MNQMVHLATRAEARNHRRNTDDNETEDTQGTAGGRHGINPKLLAIAAKLDAEYARVTTMHAEDDGSLAADCARDKVYAGISNLEGAEIAATNLEEVKLKAHYIAGIEDIYDPLAKSIIRELLDGKPTASDKLGASYAKADRRPTLIDFYKIENWWKWGTHDRETGTQPEGKSPCVTFVSSPRC